MLTRIEYKAVISVTGFCSAGFVVAMLKGWDLNCIFLITANCANAALLTGLCASRLFGDRFLAPTVHIHISIVDPLAAIGGQYTVITTGGRVATDVLAVSKGKSQVQCVTVAQVIIGQTLTGIYRTTDGVHPAGALGKVEFTEAVIVMLSG